MPHYNHSVVFCYVGLEVIHRIKFLRYYLKANLVQRWLGHAQLSTTAIYADAVGEEECHIAARLWT
jgi:integrase